MPTKAETAERDREIAILMAQGRNDAYIARKVGVSNNAIGKARKRIIAGRTPINIDFLKHIMIELLPECKTIDEKVKVFDRLASMTDEPTDSDKAADIVSQIRDAVRSEVQANRHDELNPDE